MRCTFDAKHATKMRPLAPSNAWSSATPTADSESEVPGRSAFVESERRTRTPARPSASMRARSMFHPPTGASSILKSPEWRRTPCGVEMARAQASGIEWVTAMNSAEMGDA